MSFQAPLLLLLLLALPPAALAYWRRQRRPPRDALRFPGVPTVLAALPRRGAWRRHAPALLFALAVAGLVVAVARPQRDIAVAEAQSSIMLVTDTSRSMLADDVEPSRLGAAQGAAQRFLDRVPRRVRVGLVGFSTTPDPVVAPTTERGEIRSLIDSLRPTSATATGDALSAALRTLRPNGRRRDSPAAIILLSDGKRTTGSDPIGVAREARRLRVPIYTVSLGDPGTVIVVPGTGVVLPVPPDPATMRRVARESGGRAFAVDDADRLRTVYEGLGSTLASRTERRQVTAAFAAAGAVFLLAAAALSTRRFGRLP